MSTSETVTFNQGPCPCGDGQIAKQVTSQDNPWSGVDISYSIDCPTCSREWRIEHQSLVLRSSESLLNSASAAESAARNALDNFLQSIVENYFSDFSAPTKKDEHAELERLGITYMSYRQYLEHKRKGGSICTASAPQRNLAWARAAARKLNVERQFEALTEANAQAEQATDHAGTLIVRKKIT
ncbi:hypothetical protein [Pseudomonas mandelii]|uniref:hypothetical protein n=1 Tax=Pseudomonas mandelii TaxID=75612 RepID=UPI00036BE9C3|nr:hypothetical protein [Pseudomonas mandelii]